MLKPDIILIEPQMGENIGAAARVMANFGVEQMVMVNPRDGWPNEKAHAMSSGADYILDNALIFNDFHDSIAPYDRIFATTARPRDIVKHVIEPKELKSHLTLKSAVLFGPEKSGLINQHIIAAEKIITIPVSDRYPSLNLAQAIAVICYELVDYEIVATPIKNLAPKKSIIDMLAFLEENLLQSGHFKAPHMQKKMMMNLGNFFFSANMSEQDVNSFYGIIKSLSTPRC